MLQLLTSLLRPFGWAPVEVIFVSQGIQPKDLPTAPDKITVTILRPERNLISLSWLNEGHLRFVRLKAIRTQEFALLGDLLQSVGHYALRIVDGFQFLPHLPATIESTAIAPPVPGQPLMLRWTDDTDELMYVTFVPIRE